MPVEIPNAKFPSQFWQWKGQYQVRYQTLGSTGPAILLIHGVGGNCEHWRKNLVDLSKFARVYVLDLLGYGYSDKPSPRAGGLEHNQIYNIENWAAECADFAQEVIGEPVYAVGNSLGGLLVLQMARARPQLVRGLLLIDPAVRMQHVKKQPWYERPFVPLLQKLLRETFLGELFFAQVATYQGVKGALMQAYGDQSQVTPELVEMILQPGLLPGAREVFLDTISYSEGPLAEDMLPQVACPVMIAWGDQDRWEPISKGRAYADFPCVVEFVELKGVGHCGQDEAPHLVNPLIRRFVEACEAGQYGKAPSAPTQTA